MLKNIFELRGFIPVRVIIFIFIISVLGGCAINSSTLDQGHFKNTVVIRDDPTQNAVAFSTIKGLQQKQESGGQVWDDNFLRGFINKTSGEESYQVYNVLYYGGTGTKSAWKHFSQANYDTPRGIKLTPTILLQEHENCAALTVYGQCVYNEHLVFKVDKQLFETLAKSYSADPNRKWDYILIAKTGDSYKDALPVAEIAGLMASMNEYKLDMDRKSTLGQENSIDLSNLPELLIVPPPAELTPPFLKKRNVN